ncbi:TPA: phage tail protein [Salmonella enterica subsp. enterica serovar Hvittingfoss]|nr:phage tail protein [Salmonella enterica subsp. enterica serovar Hvittingfoss]
MSQIDNIFDSAMSRADDAILDMMGISACITSEGRTYTVTAVFDDPESVEYPTGGVRIEGTSPSIFVRTVDVPAIKRLDTVVAGSMSFWVDRVGPDDSGSRHIWLGTGTPPTDNRYHG